MHIYTVSFICMNTRKEREIERGWEGTESLFMSIIVGLCLCRDTIHSGMLYHTLASKSGCGPSRGMVRRGEERGSNEKEKEGIDALPWQQFYLSPLLTHSLSSPASPSTNFLFFPLSLSLFNTTKKLFALLIRSYLFHRIEQL